MPRPRDLRHVATIPETARPYLERMGLYAATESAETWLTHIVLTQG